jgi:hypothetical protein
MAATTRAIGSGHQQLDRGHDGDASSQSDARSIEDRDQHAQRDQPEEEVRDPGQTAETGRTSFGKLICLMIRSIPTTDAIRP